MSTINLLPADYLQRRAQQRANILCLILFGVVMAGVVGAAVVSEEQARQVRDTREQVNQQYHQASQLISQMQQLEGKKQEVIAKAQMASELLERVPRSYLLATLTNALPAGGSLTKVELSTTQEKTAAAAPAGKSKFRSRTAQREGEKENGAPAKAERVPLKVTIAVTGLAQTDEQVAQFITNMKRSPLVKSAELGFSEETEIDKVMARKFKVTLELKPNAQVDAEQAPAVAPSRPVAVQTADVSKERATQ
jgi:Tfp pilus assembly protein PilN